LQQFGQTNINLANEKNISNIAIIGLQLWAEGMLIPHQSQSLFRWLSPYLTHSTYLKNNITFIFKLTQIKFKT
jgi:hypothetical protein